MTKSNLILIYGDDAAAMRNTASAVREKDSSVEIKLCNAAKFSPENVIPCQKVIVIGDLSEIEEAYKKKGFLVLTNRTTSEDCLERDIAARKKKKKGAAAQE